MSYIVIDSFHELLDALENEVENDTVKSIREDVKILYQKYLDR